MCVLFKKKISSSLQKRPGYEVKCGPHPLPSPGVTVDLQTVVLQGNPGEASTCPPAPCLPALLVEDLSSDEFQFWLLPSLIGVG